MTKHSQWIRIVTTGAVAALAVLSVSPYLVNGGRSNPTTEVSTRSVSASRPHDTEGKARTDVHAAALAPARAKVDDDAQLTTGIKQLENELKNLKRDYSTLRNAEERASRLQRVKERLTDVDRAGQEAFDRVAQHIVRAGLPKVASDRHADAVRAHTAAIASLASGLDALSAAPSPAGTSKLAELEQRLGSWQPSAPRRVFDPNASKQLLQPRKENTPRLDAQEFDDTSAESEPAVARASLALSSPSGLPGVDDPAFLAETPEIALTPAVLARANALEHKPVAIFSWAANNLEWNPGWGALQSADHTIASGRGNAVDLATALIALLRASDIPARYVHGTVELDADQFRRLAGNFDSVTAAVDFASAAGLPLTMVLSRGRPTKVRFEHVWVEAAVDFYPSRGAVNLVPDRWLALDPTIKRLESFTPPDYLALSGVPAESLMQDFASSGTADSTAGWVQGLDWQAFERGLEIDPTRQDEVSAAALAFVRDTYQPEDTASLAQQSGGIRTQPRIENALPASLPYTVLAIGARYAKVPAALQGQVIFSFGRDLDGSPTVSATLPLARVNNEKLTLSFSFASEADHDTFVSFLPTGPVTTLSQLPSSFPGYLVSVIPEIRLGEEVIIKAPAVRLGEMVDFAVSTSLPGVVGGRDRVSSVVAGSQLALVVFAGSANTANFERMRSRYAEAGALLNGGSTDDILRYAPDFTGRLSSDGFYAATLEYFAKRLTTAEFFTTGAKLGRFQLVSGVASFGYVPVPHFWFGIPRSLSLGALQFDSPNLLVNVQASSGDAEQRRLMMLRVGMLGSALEGDVPAYFWSRDPATPPAGVSAANLLRTALENGQRLYRLTEANRASIAQLQLSADAVADITAAVDRGLEVITHQSLVTVDGKLGGLTAAGYVVLDPETGEGQYLIDNGTDGGLTNTADEMMATCAYTNRPGFVDNDLDWERHLITRKCAELAKSMKEEAAETHASLMEAKIKAVIEFHEVYAKVPMVIADCITSGAPLLLSEALVLIRTAAAMLAIQTADMRSLIIAEQQEKLAKKMKEFVEAVHDFCMKSH